jgi:hypothetical protein
MLALQAMALLQEFAFLGFQITEWYPQNDTLVTILFRDLQPQDRDEESGVPRLALM